MTKPSLDPAIAGALEASNKPQTAQAFLPYLWCHRTTIIAAFSLAAILMHVLLRFAFHAAPATFRIPLLGTLVLGGSPLLYDLLRKLWKREFGSDLLGGISVVTSVALGEYLAGSIIVLMLSGGERSRSTYPFGRWLPAPAHDVAFERRLT
jgi:cation transport ATPase